MYVCYLLFVCLLVSGYDFIFDCLCISIFCVSEGKRVGMLRLRFILAFVQAAISGYIRIKFVVGTGHKRVKKMIFQKNDKVRYVCVPAVKQ